MDRQAITVLSVEKGTARKMGRILQRPFGLVRGRHWNILCGSTESDSEAIPIQTLLLERLYRHPSVALRQAQGERVSGQILMPS
jgi:hypothetical protein